MMKIKVLYEDKNILAIDKPSGISVHPSARLRTSPKNKKKESFVTDWILKNYPKMKNVGEPMGEILRPGVVHRLDKETSGILLLAKNQKSYEDLKKQFQDREIKKTYVAIVSGSMKDDRGVINKPIGRSPTDFRRRLAGRGARGELREAITEYKVLKRFRAECAQNFYPRGTQRVLAKRRSGKNSVHTEPFTYLEIKPKTGRTHQIRVHMKFLNHPVVCDSLYNPNKPSPMGISRLALHAKSIEFKNQKGKTIKIESPVPSIFSKMLK